MDFTCCSTWAIECRPSSCDTWGLVALWLRGPAGPEIEPMSPGGSDCEESTCNVGDQGPIPGSGRSPEKGNVYPPQYSVPENSMDKGSWWATAHGAAKQSKYLCKYLFSILWDICMSRISEPYDNSVFNSPTSPQVVYEGSDFSTSSPTLAIFWWFVLFCFVFNRHPSGSEVVFHCSFDLHFPNDKCLLTICVSFLENSPF